MKKSFFNMSSMTSFKPLVVAYFYTCLQNLQVSLISVLTNNIYSLWKRGKGINFDKNRVTYALKKIQNNFLCLRLED